MEMLGAVLIIIGGIIALVYTIILIIKAFQTSIWWGLAYLLIPFAALVFIIVHWQVAKKPFLMSLISIPFIVAGMILAPDTMVATEIVQ